MSVWPGRGRGPWVLCHQCMSGVGISLCRVRVSVCICDRCFPVVDLRQARVWGLA